MDSKQKGKKGVYLGISSNFKEMKGCKYSITSNDEYFCGKRVGFVNKGQTIIGSDTAIFFGKTEGKCEGVQTTLLGYAESYLLEGWQRGPVIFAYILDGLQTGAVAIAKTAKGRQVGVVTKAKQGNNLNQNGLVNIVNNGEKTLQCGILNIVASNPWYCKVLLLVNYTMDLEALKKRKGKKLDKEIERITKEVEDSGMSLLGPTKF